MIQYNFISTVYYCNLTRHVRKYTFRRIRAFGTLVPRYKVNNAWVLHMKYSKLSDCPLFFELITVSERSVFVTLSKLFCL